MMGRGLIFYFINSQLYINNGYRFVFLQGCRRLIFSVVNFGSVVKFGSVVTEIFGYPKSKSQNRGLVTRSPVNCSPKVKPCYTKLNF
jgi:hypothetical protein